MIKGIATLQELETWYSLDDVFDRNDALDAYELAEQEHAEKLQKDMEARSRSRK